MIFVNPYIYGLDNPVTHTDSTGYGVDCGIGVDCSGHGRGGGRAGSSTGVQPGTRSYSAWRTQEGQTTAPLDPVIMSGQTAFYGPVLNYTDEAIAAAGEFFIDPRLLIAIMLNEGTNRSRGEWAAESFEAVQVAAQANPSIGLMQMRFSTFVGVTSQHVKPFGMPVDPSTDVGWRDEFFTRLTDEATALRYAAAHLSDLSDELSGAGTFEDASGQILSRNDLIAFGYNAGGPQMRAVTRGISTPASMSYILDFRTHFRLANALLLYRRGP